MKCYIYALADPRDYRVRYVGKTSTAVEKRVRAHLEATKRGRNEPVCQWLRDIHPQQPIVIILQELNSNLIVRKQGHYVSTAAAEEVKWIKRFRRDCLNNLNKEKACLSWRSLLNPGEKSEG